MAPSSSLKEGSLELKEYMQWDFWSKENFTLKKWNANMITKAYRHGEIKLYF